jgi:hypothetical protein
MKKSQSLKSNDFKSSDLRVFSFDVSQDRTGWAILQGLRVLECGSLTSRGETLPVALINYLSDILKVLENVENKYGSIHFFAMEDMNMKARFNSGKILTRYQTAAMMACATLDEALDVNLVNNASVKSLFKVISRKTSIPEEINKKVKELKNSKVTAVKVQMVDAINKLYPELGLTYEQNDEADAIATGFFLVKQIMENKDD